MPSTTLAPRAPSRLRRIKPIVERVFAIDLRSLAAFRIGVGAILLGDLINRATHLTAHYTDAGVAPRHAIRALNDGILLSLHMLSGSAAWQAALFLVAGVAAVCLLLGYRTRLAIVVSWFLLLSLHIRNPYIINHGDRLLLDLMLWSTLLPLGARWSLDARRADAGIDKGPADWSPLRAGTSIVSPASAGILLQVCAIYFLSVFYKTGDTWWGDFTAIYYALNLDAFTTHLGKLLSQAPLILLQIGTAATLILEAAGPLLALSPLQTARARILAVGAFIAFHLGLMATLHLGIFVFVCVVAWLLFLPAAFWDRWMPRWARWLWFSSRRKPASGAAPHVWWDLSLPRAATSYVIGVLCLIMAVSSLWPMSDVAWYLRPIGEVAGTVRIHQRWGMFAPNPSPDDAWYAMTGILEDGSRVNLFRPSREPVTGRPSTATETYVDDRWRKFLYHHYRSLRWKAHRDELLDFL